MNLSASASLQLRTIFALMLRRIRTQYSQSRAGYLWAIAEPIMWVFVLKFAIQGKETNMPPLGESFEVFFTIGIIIARTWRKVAADIAGTLRRRGGGRQGQLPAFQQLDAAYAVWILEMTTGAVAMTIMLAALWMFGYGGAPDDMVTCAFAYLATAFFALSFALVIALITKLAPGFVHFQRLLMMGMFFTSGFSFLVDRMPPGIRDFFLWNPLVHCIEWFREGFYPGYVCASLDRVYLLSVTVVFLFVGLAGERAMRHRGAAQ